MSKMVNERIWVAVRVQRGLISDTRMFRHEESAQRCERSWRCLINPDYDETAVSAVRVRRKTKQRARR